MKKILALALTLISVFCCAVFPADCVGEEEYSLSLSADSAVLIDAQSRDILYSKSHEKRHGMASTTKIMTALIAAESCDLKKTVHISPDAIGIEGSSIYLREGETLTVEELLYALLLQSANDAATAIAIEIAGSTDAFADMMNSRADEMGLKNTHFTNPHGLSDEDHYTTAYDLAVIAAYALENEVIRRISSTYKMTIPIDSGCTQRVLVNHNKMLKLYDGAIGVKTGFTKATGRCLVSAAEREGLRLVAVTLDAPDDWNDHRTMLDFGFEHYESFVIAKPHSFRYELPIVGGDKESVTLTNLDELRLTLPKVRNDISCRVELLHRFEFAPVEQGSTTGRVYYSYGNRTVSSELIFAENVLEKSEDISFWNKFFN